MLRDGDTSMYVEASTRSSQPCESHIIGMRTAQCSLLILKERPRFLESTGLGLLTFMEGKQR